MISPVEDFWLRWHAEHSPVELAERAQLVLQAEAGGSPGQVAASLGVSTQKVEGVLAEFEHDRLATFPRPNMPLAQLAQLDPADRAGRQHVSQLAKRLFNQTRPLHHLQHKTRQLLEAAALLRPTPEPASANGAAPHDLELVDGATLADYSAGEQASISCVLRLQRKGYRADRDPAFRRLGPTEQRQVRYLAALLQVAANLDHSQAHSTIIQGAEVQAEAVRLWLTGPQAEPDGSYACRHAWLWQPVFHLALEYAIGRPPTAETEKPKAATAQNQPVGDVFSRQLAAALRKWQASLPGSADTDISGVGDLLDGVTEAQASLGAFASVLKRQPVKAVKRPLRALSDLLYAVVEQRNALSDLDAYCHGRAPTVVADLRPMREAWERTSRQQQVALRAWLESEGAAALFASLEKMVREAPVRRSKATSIRVAAPVLLDEIHSRLAEREAGVVADRPVTYRRYQQGLARLVCVLEALGGKASLGEEADQLLADARRLEGHIDRWLASTALNDAIGSFLDTWAEQQARRKAPQLFGAQSVLAYRQTRRAQWSRLRNSLPVDWRPVRASKLRRRLNVLLKRLDRKQAA